MKYLLDFTKETLSEQEAREFYSNDIIEQSYQNKDISNYIKIEKEYLKFFEELYTMNDNKVILKLKQFTFDEINYLFENEKEKFIEMFRSLSFDEIFKSQKIGHLNLEYFKTILRATIRNFYNTHLIKFEFNKLKLKMESIGDYCFIMIGRKGDLEKLEEVISRNKIDVYIKKMND